MSVSSSVPVEPGLRPTSYMQWAAVFAGAAIATAVSLVLLTFGSAIGLTVAPLAPSWRETTVTFSILSGLWVLVIATGSMAAGGYVAGRTRSTWHIAHDDEVEFRDGVHGLVVWAVAVTVGAGLSAVSAAAVMSVAAASSDRVGVIAAAPAAYEVDHLLRPEGLVPAPPPVREAAARALAAASSGEKAFGPDDRAYLVRLVSATTGASPAAAEARVDQSIAAVRAKLKAARHGAILLAFITAASAVASAAAAWEAARVGGRHRDSGEVPSLSRRRQKAEATQPR